MSKPKESPSPFGKESNQWFRGEVCNRRGKMRELVKENSEDRYVFHGWLPENPFIKKQSHIVAIGSCFAQEISKYLYNNGYRSVKPPKKTSSESIKSGTNHTFALRQLFEWAWLGKEPTNETWYDQYAKNIKRGREDRIAVAEYFSDADIFILTLGLSEIWYDKNTNDVFWRAIPEKEYDKNRHAFRVSTVEENKENLNVILDLINVYAPKAKVIITLSPVPLKATFRPVSSMTANEVSKSILRVTIDEVMRERDVQNNDKLYYWPSYELVRNFLPATVGYPYIDDNTHVNEATIAFIMETFDKHYFVQE